MCEKSATQLERPCGKAWIGRSPDNTRERPRCHGVPLSLASQPPSPEEMRGDAGRAILDIPFPADVSL